LLCQTDQRFTPGPVDPKGEKMVKEIIPFCDVVKHLAYHGFLRFHLTKLIKKGLSAIYQTIPLGLPGLVMHPAEGV